MQVQYCDYFVCFFFNQTKRENRTLLQLDHMTTLNQLIKRIVLTMDRSVVTISFLLYTLSSFMNQDKQRQKKLKRKHHHPLLPLLHYY